MSAHRAISVNQVTRHRPSWFRVICFGIGFGACSGDGSPDLVRSTLSIDDPIEGASITSFEYTFTGSCFSGETLSITVPSDVTEISSSCTDGVLEAVLQFKSGVGDYAITFTNGTQTVTRTVAFDSECPYRFVGIPGDSAQGTSDFCLAQFEMKDDTGDATTVPLGVPWVSIDQPTSEAKCQAQGWDLPTRAQFQTASRNMENVAANWRGGVVGTNVISRGHSDGTPASGLGVNDENDFWDGTGQTSTDDNTNWYQKRRLTTSNGEVIWDFGGNVWEWAKGTFCSISGGACPIVLVDPQIDNTAFREFTASTCGGGADSCFDAPESINRLLLGPSNSSFFSTTGVGRIRGGNAGGLLRGGSFNDGGNGGIYSTFLLFATTASTTNIGFRCAATPTR